MIKIIGGGMAGLLAANLLRHHDPVVIEQSESLPNNHSAVLRFRSSIVGDSLGISFKKVRMIKAPLPWKNPVADALAYSLKNTGTMRTDRSIMDGLVTAERYIAPPDLIEQMAKNVKIELGKTFIFHDPAHPKVISTIPMPNLMAAMDYEGREKIKFEYVDGVNIRLKLRGVDAYVSLLVPDPSEPFSRISITGDEMIIEVNNLDPRLSLDVRATFSAAIALLGISQSQVVSYTSSKQKYAKINPIDEDERRKFIYWASTLQGRAFSLGRFACWRPGLLLDDLVQDIRKIDGWIKSGAAEYEQEQHHNRRVS